MVWFKVDDRFHSHPKAAASTLAAVGLWAVAGSWSSDHLTDGFMPDHVIPLLSRGQTELAEQLVAAGLWRRVRGGYQFHQWDSNGDGGRRNPTKNEVVDNRLKKAQAGRKGGLASAKTRSKPQADAQASAEARASPLVQPPTRPFPSNEGKSGPSPRRADARGAATAPPPTANPADERKCLTCGNRLSSAYHRNTCARVGDLTA